jgi:fructose-1,6-bisphosphatase I
MIRREVIRAGLVDILGYTGIQNVHGDQVQKLDQFAHETLYRVLGSTGQFAVLASEEDEDVIPVPAGQPVGKYVVNFDPLDGSSNINANVNIGTIFSILPAGHEHRRRHARRLPPARQPPAVRRAT